MLRYIFIIIFSIFALFSKQSIFASSELVIPLDTAWETAFQIASSRSQYLKAVVNVMKSESPDDIAYRENFRIPPDLHEGITKDLEITYHLWALFERTLGNYESPSDRSSMLEILLEEIARVSHLADCEWANIVLTTGTPIPHEAILRDLMPSDSPFGKPQKIAVQKRDGILQTYMIIPAMNIAIQYTYEEQIYWRQMLAILKTQRMDYSPSIDTRNSLGKGSNGVDHFSRMLEVYHTDKETEIYAIRKSTLDQIEAMTSSDSLNPLKEILKKLVYPVHNLIFRLPIRSLALIDASEAELSSVSTAAVKESTKPSGEGLSMAAPSPPETESLRTVASSGVSEVVPDLLSSLRIDPAEMLSLSAAALHSPSSTKFEHIPGKLNRKGEREKAREAGLKAKSAATVAVATGPSFFLNAKHYKTLETVLKVMTERKPPKWEDFKNMIKALGGSYDDSTGNGSTEFIVAGRSFTIHTLHTKGGRMYWTQVKDFAKSGLEHIGITLETVAKKTSGK
ncbi:MAG: hypothetical protein K2Q34_07720 [Alphaproteobacteria bacterium]|nr:hypothetical protein [Alphaproteobacteria bacterium]